MTKEEFITIAQRCGYGTGKSAKKYVEQNPKDVYSTDDLVALHEGNMHWQEVNADKGLHWFEKIFWMLFVYLQLWMIP